MFSVGNTQRFSFLDKEVYIITTEKEGFHIHSQQPE